MEGIVRRYRVPIYLSSWVLYFGGIVAIQQIFGIVNPTPLFAAAIPAMLHIGIARVVTDSIERERAEHEVNRRPSPYRCGELKCSSPSSSS